MAGYSSPFAGQPLNALGAIQAGNEMAQQATDMRRQNALAQLYQTQGAGIANGDPAALNALAAFDPAAAIGIKQQQQETAFGAEKMQMLRDQAKQNAAEWAAKLSEAERQQHAATIEKGVAAGMAAQSPQEWDALMTQMGAPELVGKFDQRQGIAYSYMGIADALKAATPEVPKPQSSPGKLAADLKAGLIDRPAYDAGMDQLSKGGVNIDLGGGTNKQVFDAMSASADTANSAITGLSALKEAKKAVDQGIISGAFANQQLGLQKIGAALGVTDPTAIVNTETFRSAIAPQIAAMMRATVGSTQISNADREFAEKAAGGSITLDEASIKRLLDIMDRAGTAVVQRHMDKLNKVYPEGKGFDRERALFGVTAPQGAADPPAGSTTEGWVDMGDGVKIRVKP
jgi:hypothetical protein